MATEQNDQEERGALIVFEGLDRSGKSTQAQRLVEKIINSGRMAVLQAFPDRQSPVGEMIDRYLRGEIDMDEHALHLLFSADRFLKKKMIKQHIAQGVDVVCDRYCYSGVSYSLAKGLPEDWVRVTDQGLPKPDIVLFFQVSPEVAASRGGFGNERLETAQLQAEVAKVMPTLRDDAFWKSVNADAALAAVEKEVFQLYTELDRSKPLEVLEKI
ncbi:hypothetical protein L3Y34_016841 [Caenorhabditis briggsae]|uniref:Thymidylate kinase n=1 Tax=Caenorhabditis briggsae TaxID=6238 RepID=A0AAE9IS75_CAEBR|nr:hypothetical protein L3Y34_016841 [Caenorhabditis briggsae]